MFWMVALALVVVLALVLVLPLWRGGSSRAVSRAAVNTGIYRERLAELQAQKESGGIDPEQFEQLRLELQRTLLDDVPDNPVESAGGRGRNAILIATLLACALPALGLLYYQRQPQQPEVRGLLSADRRMGPLVEEALWPGGSVPPQAGEDPVAFAQTLQRRLQRDGLRDVDGLMLLASTYMSLQQQDLAMEALGRAQALAPGRTDVALAGVQMSMGRHSGELTPESEELLRDVLRRQPGHQGALMLLGFAAFNSGDYPEAIEAWESILANRDPASEGASLLRNSIAEARRRMGSTSAASPPTASPTPAVAESSAPSLAVSVSVARELQEQVPSNAAVFVFARAAQGPPMPLAAVRRPATELPLEVVLNDDSAMLESMRLSNFQEVVVGARISSSGSPTAQAGDLEGSTATIRLDPGPQQITVLIDRLVGG